MFDGFETIDVPTPRGAIHGVRGGSGPPLLLLHGYPQTHLMWHAAAPLLARRFTVVAADLPGYGESFHPPRSDDHRAHSKRALAEDLRAAMAALGHERFGVVGHDRGGRVGYRMALDHPGAVTALAALDIVPTAEVWARADARLALGYWHWAFLAQPAPLPERLILGDPRAYFDWHAAAMGLRAGTERYPEPVVEAYRRQLSDPATVEAICEDYRAGATVDREDDEADRDRPIACPTLVLWGERGALPVFYEDVLEVWRPWASRLSGRGIPAGHFLVEDEPEQVAEDLTDFLRAAGGEAVTAS